MTARLVGSIARTMFVRCTLNRFCLVIRSAKSCSEYLRATCFAGVSKAGMEIVLADVTKKVLDDEEDVRDEEELLLALIMKMNPNAVTTLGLQRGKAPAPAVKPSEEPGEQHLLALTGSEASPVHVVLANRRVCFDFAEEEGIRPAWMDVALAEEWGEPPSRVMEG